MNEKLGTFELWNNIQKYYYFYKMSKTTIKRQREILNVLGKKKYLPESKALHCSIKKKKKKKGIKSIPNIYLK